MLAGVIFELTFMDFDEFSRMAHGKMPKKVAQSRDFYPEVPFGF